MVDGDRIWQLLMYNDDIKSVIASVVNDYIIDHSINIWVGCPSSGQSDWSDGQVNHHHTEWLV